ncbi:ABC transporter ATP-binding protein [[Clostridium] innocuum]|nr:ABC transporter ATP-binding protein [[Clostridium] innocuum]MCR0577480.1 ABC transporter ATP-binding protein [[Clostridium] innocuum]
MNELIINHVTKTLKKIKVLNDITLEFDKGRIYGLYGRNGSGKTMLLRAIAGLIFPEKGEIRINGQRLMDDIDFPPDMGVIIEHTTLLPQYSAFMNLKLLSEIRKVATEEDIRTALKRVNLDPDDNRKVKVYSLGMKQRLAIAQAIFEHPKFLLLDEPTNALDEESIMDIRTLLLSMRDEGCMILLASHNKEDLKLLCDEIYRMDEGRLTKFDSSALFDKADVI